jgi:putative sigma-54 modulation protein
MNIYKMTGRNIDVSDAMRTYAEDKLSKLDRFSDQIVDAKVVMSYNDRVGDGPAKVEVQVNVPNGIVRAEERGPDHYGAIDLVVDKLERQLKKFKGRPASYAPSATSCARWRPRTPPWRWRRWATTSTCSATSTPTASR